MGIKKLELINGCFAKAADDEPLFVLRAQDSLAPQLVRMWAAAFRNEHTTMHKDVIDPTLKSGIMQFDSEKSKAKYNEAMSLADQMEAWPTRKMPD